MISTALRRVSAAAAVIIAACLIAAKRVGPVNGWVWFSVDSCALTATQFTDNPQPSPPVLPRDSMKVSLLLGPALGCSTTYSQRWTP